MAIRFEYKISGGCFVECEYLICGGPDDGRRLRMLMEATYDSTPEDKYGCSYYNGTKEQWEKAMAPYDRPCIKPGNQYAPETLEAFKKFREEKYEEGVEYAVEKLGWNREQYMKEHSFKQIQVLE